MKTRIVLLLLAVTLIAAAFMQMQAQVAKPQAARALPATSTAAAPDPATPPRAPSIAVKPRVDGAQAYKSNCLRCHTEPRKFSERAMVTVVRHMRVRANLTEEESKAILTYLTK